MMRYLASAALPPGQAINEELIANIAPLLDQVGSVFGEVRGTKGNKVLNSASFFIDNRVPSGPKTVYQ